MPECEAAHAGMIFSPMYNVILGLLISILIRYAKSAAVRSSINDSQFVFRLNSSLGAANLPTSNPTQSFWVDSPGANPLGQVGSKGILTDAADVCIIGSGITGVSVAYHLAEGLKARALGVHETVKAVVLEARDFCKRKGNRSGLKM